MEKANQVSNECGTGDQSAEGDLWAGPGTGEGFGPGEKICECMPHRAIIERTVLEEARETEISEIISYLV